MPRNYHSSAAKCPYYRGENAVMVFCSGICGAETVRMFFRDGKNARIHKARFCRREWEKCRMAETIQKQEGEVK